LLLQAAVEEEKVEAELEATVLQLLEKVQGLELLLKPAFQLYLDPITP
jgi:hypothetical protein